MRIRTAIEIAVATALAAGVTAGAAGAADALQAPPTRACYTFSRSAVPIYETPTDGVVSGRGQQGQLFVSSPPTTAHAGGKTWVRGTDEITAVSGWVYLHNLTADPAC